jgi:hypothetical protein
MEKLCPVKHITKQNFSGKILIDGDLHENCILFRFLFDRPEMVQPLLIWIKVLDIGFLKRKRRRTKEHNAKIFVMECNIPDFNNPVMKTCLWYPEWLLRKSVVRVIDVEAQMSCQV